MLITKKISKDNEFYLYLNGKLIYKKWLNTGQSKIFDVMAYDKYTYASYNDLKIESSHDLIKIKAKIRLRTTEEGGRVNGISSGYRPNHVFEYKENGMLKETFIGDIQFGKGTFLELGKECEVMVRFLLIPKIERFMEIGRKWWIHEGALKVGEAEIIEFEVTQDE